MPGRPGSPTPPGKSGPPGDGAVVVVVVPLAVGPLLLLPVVVVTIMLLLLLPAVGARCLSAVGPSLQLRTAALLFAQVKSHVSLRCSCSCLV